MYLTTFIAVFLAELGDKTQLATMLFAAQPGARPAAVFAAAAAALVASALLAVVVGAALGSWLPPERVKSVAAVGFIAVGVWMLVRG
ncbi:MAG: TMEM165/GDT1 family protein [Candidatus Rokubacteria bacterium]|nr:TMEM165/GDT1 family protein [Candidatus Rokubacteria bacterium]